MKNTIKNIVAMLLMVVCTAMYTINAMSDSNLKSTQEAIENIGETEEMMAPTEQPVEQINNQAVMQDMPEEMNNQPQYYDEEYPEELQEGTSGEYIPEFEIEQEDIVLPSENPVESPEDLLQ